MDKIFLDTNFFMRLLEGQLKDERKKLDKYQCYVSTLSIHITMYVHKLSVPHPTLRSFLKYFGVLPLSRQTSLMSLEGPTSDYEDNLQLTAAAENGINIFITLDKELLKLKQFQSVKIISPSQL